MDKSPDAFRTISEVADWLQTPAHVLRFWESKFAQVKPVKRAGGRRYYRPADMLLLGGIKKLLHDDGMTIKGVQKILREQGVRHVARLSARQLEGAEAEADADFGPEAEIEDAPFVEVEAPEPEERLIAFPSSASRPPTPKPDLPPDPPPTPGPDLPDGPGDIDAAPGEGEAAEMLAEDDATPTDDFAGSAQAEPAGMSADALSTLVDAPSDEDHGVAADDRDGPALDARADETEGAVSAADVAEDSAPDQDEAWDATATPTGVPASDGDALEASGEAPAPGAARQDASAADLDDKAAAFSPEPTMPQPVPPATKPGAMGRLAWLETLSDEQCEAVRAALPALRALHERLSASTAGE